MLAYIVRRILLAGLTLSLMSVLTFVVMQLPEGDYSRQVADQLREFYGLDKPAAVQYWKWISKIVTKLEFGHALDDGTRYGIANISYWRGERDDQRDYSIVAERPHVVPFRQYLYELHLDAVRVEVIDVRNERGPLILSDLRVCQAQVAHVVAQRALSYLPVEPARAVPSPGHVLRVLHGKLRYGA